MTKENIIKEIKKEAKSSKNYVFITDKGEICCSGASYSALKMAGGKLCIIPIGEIWENNIGLRNDWYWGKDCGRVTVDELAQMVFEYLES